MQENTLLLLCFALDFQDSCSIDFHMQESKTLKKDQKV